MRQALVELSDSGSQVGETFQKVAGKSFKEFLAEGHNTSEALNVLDEYAKSTGLSIDQLFSSVEAGNAAAQLTGGHAKTFADDIAAMGSSAGATEEAYGKMTDTFQHKTELLSAAWDDVKLDSGEALAEALSPAADSLLENMDEIKEPVVNFFSAIGDIISDLVPLLPGFLNALSSGLSAVGKIIGPLAKTMAGNPEAVGKGLTSIAAGMLAFKGINAASGFTKSLKGVEGITGVLGKLAPTIFSNPWAAGAAAVVGAVTAIGLAVHEYNKQQISNSLADHFGDIELTAAQIEDVAGHILNAKYLVNVEAALNEFQNADKLAEEAEAALAENDALEWKASIGMTWDESEVSEYISNIDEFISSSIEELESRSYAATITVETMLGGTEEGQTLAEQMKQWAVSDQLEMETLSQQLKSAVEKAMTDGVLDANEQAAITILQSKMNNILASWKEADAQAELDLIDQKYGSASGKDLTAETFQKVVDELGKQREEAQKSLEESYTALMSTLHGLDNSGRLEETGMSFEKLQTQAGYAYRNAAASSLANSVNFEKNTLSDTYGDLLQQNYAEMEKSTSTFVGNARNLLSSNDLQGVFDQLNAGVLNAQTYSGLFSSGDQKALANIYEAMKPDVSAMQSLMGEYREAGQAIPQELMTSFNEAMKVGAAAGDASAAWQVFANQMVEDAGGVENALNDSLISAIQDGTASAPQQLKDALDIALSETTPEPLTMDEVAVSLAGFDLDVSQIAELTGMTETEVKAALDKMGIEYDAEVDVNTKAGTVDASGAEAAGQQAEEAAKSAAGEDTTVEKTVTADTTYVAGTTDTSQVEDAANAELASGTAEQEIVTDTTYNNYGQDYAYPHEKGVPCTFETDGRTAHCLTGSGPATWYHNWMPDGIADLNGNVWEWCAGMRLKNGEIQIIPYSNCMAADASLGEQSTLWKAIKADGSIVEPGTAGTLKWDYVDSKLQLTDGAVAYTTDGSVGCGYKDMTLKAGLSAPEIAKALLLYPDEPGGDYGGDTHYANLTGERLPFCGGGWGDTSFAGVFYVYLSSTRANSISYIGFRSAFCEL